MYVQIASTDIYIWQPKIVYKRQQAFKTKKNLLNLKQDLREQSFGCRPLAQGYWSHAPIH